MSLWFVQFQTSTMSKEQQVEAVFPKLASAIRSASGLASNDVNFYKSLERDVAVAANESSNNILNLINSLISSSSDAQEASDSTLKESWSEIGNILDIYLERSDIAFDNLRKPQNPTNNDSITYLDDGHSLNSNTTQKRLEKPQLQFKTPIDNSELHPFKPLLKSKPNAITPFKDVFTLVEYEENVPIHYKHPYEREILEQEYNENMLEVTEPIPSQDWESTDFIWVDDTKKLQELLQSLKQATEIAVDLEHHDYRSYYGIVCLMQISTRDQDWLIDTLKLREELHILNEVFTDSKITKVFHGAFMDIIWLQRDLGLYVVSLFDTYHASRQLGFPKHSLAYLLERFANFKTSKKYQLADWRIRPLSKPMKLYARSDTHFLLNIFDQLRNQLIESNKLEKVLYESRNVAIRRFEYSRFRPEVITNSVVTPIEKDDAWKKILYQYNISNSKAPIVEALYNWRDETARRDDESPRYIMPNQLLASLTSLSPTDPAGVLSASNAITEHVRKNSKIIAELIANVLKNIEVEDFRLLNDAIDEAPSNDEDTVTFGKAQQSELFFQSRIKPSSDSKGPTFNDAHSQLFKSIPKGGKKTEFWNVSENNNLPRELSERQSLIQDSLNVISGAGILAHEEDVSETPVQEVEVKEEEAEKVKNERPDMFDATNDIIVLKQKRKQQQKQKKDSVKKEHKEDIDYTKAEKVIKVPSYKERRNEKKRSSSSFDPYSKESEGPKPAKKQAKLQQGKTTSFVEKRRKR